MAGIYIHIPFCRKRCSYCDFHFSTTFHDYRSALIKKIGEELEFRKTELTSPIKTLYFGGGTPSLLTDHELTFLINEVHKHYNTSSLEELTFEVNPEDVTIEKLLIWKTLGINRLSIGIQSIKEEDLKWMNRSHSANFGKDAILMAADQGFLSINADIIYGLPKLTEKEWVETLKQLSELPINHVSAYCLTVEEKTALYKNVQKGMIKIPSDVIIEKQFILMIEILTSAGFEQYEVSNFSRNGGEAKHNSNYWKGALYNGYGPSAHSYNGKERRWNVANNLKYTKADFSSSRWFDIEVLSEENRWNELFLTGLRTKWGVDITKLDKLGGLKEGDIHRINHWRDEGCLLHKEHYITLTKEGLLFADKIAQDFFRLT